MVSESRSDLAGAGGGRRGSWARDNQYIVLRASFDSTLQLPRGQKRSATLRSLASRSEVSQGLDRLRRLVHELGDREPSTEEIEEWSREIPT